MTEYELTEEEQEEMEIALALDCPYEPCGKENTMNELERVREGIAMKLYSLVTTYSWANAFPATRNRFLNKADKILSLKGIRIECDDQSLPENYHNNASLIITYNTAQQDMLKPDSEGNHWMKVIPKENKE